MKTSLPQVARITHVAVESDKVRTLTLDLCLEAEPGQFVMAWLPGVDEKPFSLASAEPVALTIARVGPFTTAVHSLEPGDRLWVRGPLGQPFSLPKGVEFREEGRERQGTSGTWPPASCLLVAGGYGVAPLCFLAERLLAAGWAATVVVGARNAADVILVERLARLGVRTVVTTDDGSLGEQGLATDAAARLLEQGAYAAVYACGPEPMLLAVERLARAGRLPAQVSHERLMRCGFGVCGSCTRQGWLVCRDGPVMKIEP
jgi:dihydroorotate dehydrogenase electron transfer subunit